MLLLRSKAELSSLKTASCCPTIFSRAKHSLIDENAASGSYLLEFTFSAAGLNTSESIFIVFNNGMDDELFEETVEWAEANIVPVHGAWLLLGGLGLRRRNRRD